MKTIRDLYEEKELENLEESIAAGVAKAATVLGFGTMAGVSVFGVAVLVASAKKLKLGSRIKKLFRRLAGKDKKLNYEKGVKAVRAKSKDYDISYRNSKIADNLTDVFMAIEKRDYKTALEEYKASGVYGTSDAVRAISLAVTEEFGEPPLYYISPGNRTYQFLKRIIGPSQAKAVSDSVLFALNKNKQYFTDIEISQPRTQFGDKEEIF